MEEKCGWWSGGCLVVNTWKENVKCEMAVGEK